MLSPCVVQEVERLLAAGHSRRQVSRLTGVSRVTVNQIAANRRPNYATPKESQLSSLRPKKPRRCATCGGLVYPPCKLCRIRAKLAEHAKKVA
jgi:hypothetical protein